MALTLETLMERIKRLENDTNTMVGTVSKLEVKFQGLEKRQQLKQEKSAKIVRILEALSQEISRSFPKAPMANSACATLDQNDSGRNSLTTLINELRENSETVSSARLLLESKTTPNMMPGSRTPVDRSCAEDLHTVPVKNDRALALTNESISHEASAKISEAMYLPTSKHEMASYLSFPFAYDAAVIEHMAEESAKIISAQLMASTPIQDIVEITSTEVTDHESTFSEVVVEKDTEFPFDAMVKEKSNVTLSTSTESIPVEFITDNHGREPANDSLQLNEQNECGSCKVAEKEVSKFTPKLSLIIFVASNFIQQPYLKFPFEYEANVIDALVEEAGKMILTSTTQSIPVVLYLLSKERIETIQTPEVRSVIEIADEKQATTQPELTIEKNETSKVEKALTVIREIASSSENMLTSHLAADANMNTAKKDLAKSIIRDISLASQKILGNYNEKLVDSNEKTREDVTTCTDISIESESSSDNEPHINSNSDKASSLADIPVTSEIPAQKSDNASEIMVSAPETAPITTHSHTTNEPSDHLNNTQNPKQKKNKKTKVLTISCDDAETTFKPKTSRNIFDLLTEDYGETSTRGAKSHTRPSVAYIPLRKSKPDMDFQTSSSRTQSHSDTDRQESARMLAQLERDSVKEKATVAKKGRRAKKNAK
ncbi:hypothetical protein HDU97_006436 [Phlyctochytrium planicorne]|nr:hypothetical protein HDU97_006436 [Phlyctochytrium planicorne]